ncbi:hypothetical protein L804_06001 [Cryptococcus deuterogattii 2001/935-1]|nr:hypothetical protein L804_06001 [Cryptococcus deuterogattii 2001/935-1]
MVVLDCVKARGTYDSPMEKPACLEVEELDELIKIAKETSHFFMEVFYADFFMDENFDALPDFNRMINPSLGGGSLLDMSAYLSVWAMLRVHRHSLNADKDSNVTKGIWLLPTALPDPTHSTSIPDPLASPALKAPSLPPPLTITLSMMETMGCHTKQMRLRGVLWM